MTTPARKYHQYMTHQISVTVNYNSTGIATGVLVGEIPSGSLVGTTTVIADTAFNAGTSAALSVGYTGTGADLISAQDVKTAAVRVDTVAPVAKARLAADQAVYVSCAMAGTAATAGTATIIVTYQPNIG